MGAFASALGPLVIRYGGRRVPGFTLGETPARPEAENRHFFDRYSLSHAAWGMIFEGAGIHPAVSIGSHVAFEAVEDGLKKVTEHIWPDSRPDGWQNHVGDVLSFAGGMVAARELRGSAGGRAAMTGVGALAGAIFAWSLADRHSRSR